MPARRKALATTLAVAGSCGLLWPLFWAGGPWMSIKIAVPEFLAEYAWASGLVLLHLFAGLGLITGSRAWTLITALLLAADAFIAVSLARDFRHYHFHPVEIFDRMWLLPPTLVLTLCATWALLATAGLVTVAWRSSR